MMSNEIKQVLSELEDHEKYKKMAESTNDPEYKSQLMEMAEDELKHLKYLMKMYPEIASLIEKLKTINLGGNPY